MVLGLLEVLLKVLETVLDVLEVDQRVLELVLEVVEVLLGFEPPLSPGIITRVHLCWNFGRLVPETLMCYRYQPMTPGSYLLGAFFWHNVSSN